MFVQWPKRLFLLLWMLVIRKITTLLSMFSLFALIALLLTSVLCPVRLPFTALEEHIIVMTADQSNISSCGKMNDANALLEEKAEPYYGALFYSFMDHFIPIHIVDIVPLNALKASDNHFLFPERSRRWGLWTLAHEEF